MNKKYLIFTDLDLTIYPECKIMPREIIDYFNKLVDSGNMVVLCTGRPLTGSKYIYDLFSSYIVFVITSLLLVSLGLTNLFSSWL